MSAAVGIATIAPEARARLESSFTELLRDYAAALDRGDPLAVRGAARALRAAARLIDQHDATLAALSRRSQ